MFCFVFNRSPTDENPIETPKSNPTEPPADGSNSTIQSSSPPVINLSSHAKPFEKTDNSNRLSETIVSTEKTPTSRLSSKVANNNKEFVDVVRPLSNQDNKKVVSLTSGFSIRRNPNNTNNPYTLTVLTRPIDEYSKSRRRIKITENIKNREPQSDRYYYENDNNKEQKEIKAAIDLNDYDRSSETITSRKDFSPEITIDDDIPIYVRPTVQITSKPSTTETPRMTSTSTVKYYIKTVLKRPAPFSINNSLHSDSTENSLNTEALIDTALENTRRNKQPSLQSSVSTNSKWSSDEKSDQTWETPAVSPYKSLNNLKNDFDNQDNFVPESTSSTVSTTHVTSPQSRSFRTERPRTKPSYYTYSLVDEEVPNQTTEVFSGKVVKNVIKAFLNNLVSTPKRQFVDELSYTTARTTPEPEEKTVNIGFQKKMLKYVDEKPVRNNVKRLQIITEPSINEFIPSNDEEISFTAPAFKDFSSTSTSTTTAPSPVPIIITETPTTPMMLESSTNNEFRNTPSRRYYETDFDSFVPSKPEPQKSRKFQKLFDEPSSTEPNIYDSISYINSDDPAPKFSSEGTRAPVEIDWDRPTNRFISEIASTTSTTKATMTSRVEPTATTKSLSFPTRASRVNPAIKLAATNPGGGRRSYQTSSKCSSDNSLQANPKCNEIKYQRYK